MVQLKTNRKITVEQYEQLDEDMAGLCTACGFEQFGCEPDAEKYSCESCGEKAVYGPHWWLMTGKVE